MDTFYTWILLVQLEDESLLLVCMWGFNGFTKARFFILSVWHYRHPCYVNSMSQKVGKGDVRMKGKAAKLICVFYLYLCRKQDLMETLLRFCFHELAEEGAQEVRPLTDLECVAIMTAQLFWSLAGSLPGDRDVVNGIIERVASTMAPGAIPSQNLASSLPTMCQYIVDPSLAQGPKEYVLPYTC